MRDVAAGWKLIDENAPPAPNLPQVPEPPTEEEQREREAIRLQRRHAIRLRIAAARLAESRWREISTAIEEITAQKESSVAEHVAACAPIQTELKAIHEAEVTALVAKQSFDPALERRRKDLAAELDRRNADLQSSIAEHDRQLGELGRARREAGLESGVSTLENELLHFGRPDQVVRLRVLQARSLAASERLTFVRSADMRGRTPDAYHKAIVDDAAAEVARLTKETDALFQEIVDE